MRKALVASASLALLLLTAPAARAGIDVSFADGTMTVSAAETADDITVTCVSDSVDVSGQDTGVACDAVERLEIHGAGGGDEVDLGAVSSDAFAAVRSVKVWGEDGDDTLLGSPLDDRLNGGPGVDELRGDDGKDRLTPEDGGGVVAGGRGRDRVLVSGAGPWTFDRRSITTFASSSEETHLQSVETIVYRGTADADTVAGVGFRGLVIANGVEGDDLIHGGTAADRLIGGPGDDHLDGGPGNDVLLGKIGDDFLSGGDGTDTLVGGPGSDFCLSGPGNDVNRSC